MIKLCGENGLSELEETTVTLVMYNQSEIKPLGKKRFKVVNPNNNKMYNIALHFVRGDCKSSQNILSVESSGVEEKFSRYADVFTTEGGLEGHPLKTPTTKH